MVGGGRPAAHRPGYQLVRQWRFGSQALARLPYGRLASHGVVRSSIIVRGGDLLRRPTGYTAADSCASPINPENPGAPNPTPPVNNSNNRQSLSPRHEGAESRLHAQSQLPGGRSVQEKPTQSRAARRRCRLNECRRRPRRCHPHWAERRPCQAGHPCRAHPAAGTACRRRRTPSG